MGSSGRSCKRELREIASCTSGARVVVLLGAAGCPTRPFRSDEWNREGLNLVISHCRENKK